MLPIAEVISMISFSPFMLSNTPCGSVYTLIICLSAGTIEMITSLARVSCAMLAAVLTPCCANGSIAAATTSYTVTSNPAFTRFCAIGLPIRPRPIKPIF